MAKRGWPAVLSRLMFEAMREAERDPALRERMGALLDPDLDVRAALDALRALLAPRPS